MGSGLGYVYFVRAAGLDLIKIGWTGGHPAKRLRELSQASPVELAFEGVMLGTWQAEQALHLRFAHLRVRGEWFRAAPELVAFIGENAPPWPDAAAGTLTKEFRFSRVRVRGVRDRAEACASCRKEVGTDQDLYLYRTWNNQVERGLCDDCARFRGQILPGVRLTG